MFIRKLKQVKEWGTSEFFKQTSLVQCIWVCSKVSAWFEVLNKLEILGWSLSPSGAWASGHHHRLSLVSLTEPRVEDDQPCILAGGQL